MEMVLFSWRYILGIRVMTAQGEGRDPRVTTARHIDRSRKRAVDRAEELLATCSAARGEREKSSDVERSG